MTSEAYPGKRLSLGGNLCTIRFCGEVEGTKGQWLGVEWDDPSRGKHAGTHEGVEYFRCLSKQPNAASFIRPIRPSDPAVTFVEAVEGKYASVDDPQEQDVPTERLGDGAIRISGKEVEEVGFDKIRKQLSNLQQLRIVIVDTLCIHRPRAGHENEPLASDVAETCPRAVELDLSRNLLETWDGVVDICRQLPDLRTLRADGNRFSSLSHSSSLSQYLRSAPFTTMKSLSLDDTLLSWAQICQIVSPLTSLSSISASANEYSRLPETSLPPSVTSITLERNEFETLDCLRSLTALGNIRFLSLKSSRIRTSSPESTNHDRAPPLVFPESLQELDISDNDIRDWTFIDSLAATFPRLTALRVSNNPLYENLRSAAGRALNADDGYMLTLARLGSLTRLNFSTITPKERLNAETYYLSQITQELAVAPPDQAVSIIARNARYPELCRTYGQPEVNRTAPQTLNPDSLAARVVNLQFTLDAALAEHVAKAGGNCTNTTFQISIPRSCTIYTVLGLVGKRARLPPLLLRLVWESEELDRTADVDEAAETEDSDTDEEPQNKEEVQTLSKNGQVLQPRTRTLSTWFENVASAHVRVDWSQEDLTRRRTVHSHARF